MVTAVANAPKDASAVCYAHKLQARRVNQGKKDDEMTSDLSAWTKPQLLHNDINLPVIVTDDREFYLKTVHEIW